MELSNGKTIILVGDKVLIEPEKNQRLSEHGVLLPPGVKEKVISGYVIETGPGYPVISMNHVAEKAGPATSKDIVQYAPLQARVGDYVLSFHEQALEIELDGKKHLIVPQSSLLMIIRGAPLEGIPKKIYDIQKLLREHNVESWLFYDFWKRNEFAQRILEIPSHLLNTRRFFYLIPAASEPRKLVHSIERLNLEHLPGSTTVYLSWQSLEEGLKKILSGIRTVAMEYSPYNAIPNISKVDAGTIELVRKQGVHVVSSADLAQHFEARWSEEQYRDNAEVAQALRSIVDKTFAFMREKILARERITEYDVQQFMLMVFAANDLITDFPPNCSVNENSGNPHYEPTKEVHAELHEGDFVLIDLWAKKNKPRSVYSDITWVGFLGSSVPEKYTKIFNIAAGARDAAVEFLKKSFAEGKTVRGYEVDDVARGYITARGYGDYFIHRTGHSIGEDIHGTGTNIDNLETHDERVIIPQTSFSIEPGIYFMGQPDRGLAGDFGIRSEINVYISKDYEVVVTGEPRQKEVIAILK